MKKIYAKKDNFFFILFIPLAYMLFIVYDEDYEKGLKEEKKANEYSSTDQINWLSYEEAARLNAKKKKKIIVDVYTDWCGWCKKMDNTTMKDPRIVEYINKNFYAVKLNAESQKCTVYKGYKIIESELAHQVFKVNGYPTIVYLDEGENVLSPVSGYFDVKTFYIFLQFYGENRYKFITFDEFQREDNTQK